MGRRAGFDLVGLGLNATDTAIIVPEYPEYSSKIAFLEERVEVGGQVATAVAACQTLGKHCKYIGSLGDDERGRLQLRSLEALGVDIKDVRVVAGCPSQTAYILIDRRTGERTVLWYRDDRLAMTAEMLEPAAVRSGRMLHLDGCDVEANAQAALWARQAGIPVASDIDTLTENIDRLLQYVDYFMGSANFPPQYTGEHDPFRALEMLRAEFGMRMAAMTLGADGVLALGDSGFLYRPAYEVDAVDTTGAGDVFRGAFCYTMLEQWPLERALDFSCAMAALNCTRMGARGGLARLPQVRDLMQTGARRVNREYLVR
jgi:sugar/nucleoside kinase (ribokinase family)